MIHRDQGFQARPAGGGQTIARIFHGDGLGRAADSHRRQSRRIDLELGDVRLAIAADHLRLDLARVAQLDGDLLCGLDHVCVGEQVAVGADDESGAERLRFELARSGSRNLGHEAAEELVERVILRNVWQPRSAAAGGGCGTDVHDRRAVLLDQVAEVRELGRGPLGKRKHHEREEERSHLGIWR